MPLINQLQLFRQATVVIAPHGAGLANLLASRPGTGVLEFLTERDMNLCNMFAALKLGLFYHPLVVRGSSHGGLFHVDVHEALDTLRALLNSVSLASFNYGETAARNLPKEPALKS